VSMSDVQLSLIIPAYNGGRYIADRLASALLYLQGRPENSELIVVDDGSTDGSTSLLSCFAANHCSVRLIRNSANRGKGYAVRVGVLHSRGERVVFTDADLAYPPEQIETIVQALDAGADLAIADRTAPQSLYHMSPEFFSYFYTRHLLSRLFNFLVRCWLGLKVRDCQAGLKGFRRDAADLIFPRLRLDGFAFDVELLYIAKRLGLEVRQVPIEFRYFSEPSTVDFIRDSIGSMRDLVRVRLNAMRGRYS
jgi:glycosyltransferase involved in cell wall biosynthesis